MNNILQYFYIIIQSILMFFAIFRESYFKLISCRTTTTGQYKNSSNFVITSKWKNIFKFTHIINYILTQKQIVLHICRQPHDQQHKQHRYVSSNVMCYLYWIAKNIDLERRFRLEILTTYKLKIDRYSRVLSNRRRFMYSFVFLYDFFLSYNPWNFVWTWANYTEFFCFR